MTEATRLLELAECRRIADLELALEFALSRLIHDEPGDSRAVSNEFVAMAGILADLDDLTEHRAILSQQQETKL
jgi:hypothetical protein